MGDKRGRPAEEILDPLRFSNFPNPVLCNTAINNKSDNRTALAQHELVIDIANPLTKQDKQLTSKHPRWVPLGEWIIEDPLLYVSRLLYVHNNKALYQEIMHAY